MEENGYARKNLIKIKNLSTGAVILTVVPSQQEWSKLLNLLVLNGLKGKYQILKEDTYLGIKKFDETVEEFSMVKTKLLKEIKPENGMVFGR